MLGLGVLRAKKTVVRAPGVPSGCSRARPHSRRQYLCYPLQAAQRGPEMLILLGAEAGDLEVLGEGSREGESSSGLSSRA